MIKNQSYYADLLTQFFDNSLEIKEVDELLDWVKNNPEDYNNILASNAVHAHLMNYASEFELSDGKSQLIRERLFKAMEKQDTLMPAVHRVHFLRTAWFRYAAAILIIFGIGAYLFTTQNKESLITDNKPVPVKNDILPGSDRAILTLSNGQQIELNNAASETIKDGELNIKNNSGQLVYSPIPSNGGVAPGAGMPNGRTSEPGAGVGRGAVGFNTMSTPKAAQYQLTLSDGTRVWLNAASSITYPVAFTGGTREVSITGEAYFEVAKNTRQPFIVKTPKENITVLGTSFNINAYPDEENVKTSLLEGSVKISNTILKPGQAYTNGKVIITNVEQDIAWKNGFFNFNGADLKMVMRQLGRWYDVEIVYESIPPTRKFRGKLSRDLTLSQVLEILKDINVKFEIKGKTLLVK